MGKKRLDGGRCDGEMNSIFRTAAWTAVWFVLAPTSAAYAHALPTPSPRPVVQGHAGTRGFGVVGGLEQNKQAARQSRSQDGRRRVTRRTVDCGPPSLVGHPLAATQSICGLARQFCDVADPTLLPKRRVTDIVVITTFPDGQSAATPVCYVPRRSPNQTPTAAMAREAAQRLLPHPRIGVAPPGGVTLVNIETVLWVATRADRFLGTVTLLGQRVDLRAHVEQVRWDFGDGSTDTTTTPGKAYTAADPCKTVDCPDYFGHTYLHTGEVRISAQLIWTGEFRVDGGAWQPITGTVAAPATGTSVHVKEARGILVPNP